MAKWSGSVSAMVPVPVDKVWAISQFGELHRWDANVIQNCYLEQGDGRSSGSVRRVFFRHLGGSTAASLLEYMTYYDADTYTFTYAMGENPLGYSGYSCTFSLEDNGDGSTTVNYNFVMDPIEGTTEDAVVSPIEGVCRRRIYLLETVAADR